jgi:hypothetical protein
VLRTGTGYRLTELNFFNAVSIQIKFAVAPVSVKVKMYIKHPAGNAGVKDKKQVYIPMYYSFFYYCRN